jgi:hypothetical protein
LLIPLALALAMFARPALVAPGDLDPTFDGDGIRTDILGVGTSVANAIARQTDGKLVVAGSADVDHVAHFALARNEGFTPNLPPTISDIANQSTDEDAPTSAIGFTIGDAETDPTSLRVTATSDNQALTPNANITLGGSGANRTVTITPAANQSGAATVTITVSDGVSTASDTFVLTVNPTADAPTATFTSGATVSEGSSVSVSFSNPADPDPADMAAGLRYSYDFDDDGTFDLGDGTYAGGVADATATIPAALLADGPASVAVRGRIADKDGSYTDYTTTIMVENAAPKVSAGGPYRGTANSPIALSATATDSGQDSLSYAWDLDGDGQFDDAAGASASFSATKAGVYTVRVRATDKDGASAIAEASVTVAEHRVFVPLAGAAR